MTALAEWQRGVPIEALRMHAELYRQRHKPLIHGAFGLMKERDVASALLEQRLAFIRNGDGIVASAFVHRLRAGSKHADFRGAALQLQAGQTFVSAFACSDAGYGARLLRQIEERSTVMAVEIFEEDELAREVMRAEHMPHLLTKISAGSEIKGVYSSYPFPVAPLTAEEAATLEVCREQFVSAEHVAAVLDEIRSFESSCAEQSTVAWADHYSSYNKRRSWSALALRGYDPRDPSFIIAPREMSRAWKEENPARMVAACNWTPVCERFPAAMSMVDRLPGPKDRVRLMRLEGAGELTRHADITDRLAGIADGRIARLHIPLRTNPGVRFMGWNHRGERIERRLPEGALCYLDQRKPHAVKNESPEERVHLVVDVISSPALRELLFR